MFTSDMAESRQKTVVLKGLDAAMFGEILSYIYSGTLHVSLDRLQHLYQAADCKQTCWAAKPSLPNKTSSAAKLECNPRDGAPAAASLAGLRVALLQGFFCAFWLQQYITSDCTWSVVASRLLLTRDEVQGRVHEARSAVFTVA
ncbi:hypothetical protein Bbelb_191540 [Branchiostoma belcheri]|nr:hypothetical protein Bbelb_191540 [Branchiostoma belcheri]